MTKFEKVISLQENEKPEISYTPLEKGLIGIACISFFPAVYFIGKAITSWLS